MARILVLCSRVPYPLTGGAKLRMYNTAKLLAEEHTVDILAMDERPVEQSRRDALSQAFNESRIFTYPSYLFYLHTLPGLVSKQPLQTHYYAFDEIKQWLRAHIDRYDLLYCNHVRTTEYARPFDMPKIVDFVDAISRTYAESGREASGVWRAIYPIESRRLLRYERAVAREFDHSFIISDIDRQYVQHTQDALPRLSVLPNGVRERFLTYDADGTKNAPPSLVFIGKMDYFPNIDAVTYFADEILPHIRERQPDVVFRIVGTSPTERVKSLDTRPGIDVTGFVDEPIEYLERADISVAPMRYGSGVQNKVLEAMALGKPVVTTPLGREGIIAESGIHLEVCEGADEFARTVSTLLDCPEKRQQLGNQARELIPEHYTWNIVGQTLLPVVESVLSQSG